MSSARPRWSHMEAGIWWCNSKRNNTNTWTPVVRTLISTLLWQQNADILTFTVLVSSPRWKAKWLLEIQGIHVAHLLTHLIPEAIPMQYWPLFEFRKLCWVPLQKGFESCCTFVNSWKVPPIIKHFTKGHAACGSSEICIPIRFHSSPQLISKLSREISVSLKEQQKHPQWTEWTGAHFCCRRWSIHLLHCFFCLR